MQSTDIRPPLARDTEAPRSDRFARMAERVAALVGVVLLGVAIWQSTVAIPGGDEGTCGSVFAPVGGNCDVLYERAVNIAPIVFTGASLVGLSVSLLVLTGRRHRRLLSVAAAVLVGVALVVIYLVVAAHLTYGHGGR